jgi:hypothetical protein
MGLAIRRIDQGTSEIDSRAQIRFKMKKMGFVA